MVSERELVAKEKREEADQSEETKESMVQLRDYTYRNKSLE